MPLAIFVTCLVVLISCSEVERPSAPSSTSKDTSRREEHGTESSEAIRECGITLTETAMSDLAGDLYRKLASSSNGVIWHNHLFGFTSISVDGHAVAVQTDAPDLSKDWIWLEKIECHGSRVRVYAYQFLRPHAYELTYSQGAWEFVAGSSPIVRMEEPMKASDLSPTSVLALARSHLPVADVGLRRQKLRKHK